MTPTDLARLDQDGFVAAFGEVFEHSPWIAEAAWAEAPFHSAEAVHAAMVSSLDAAGIDASLALVRAHPDLAGKAALSGTLTADSTKEQALSGLSSLTPDELARFTALNTAYRSKFQFPFVMAVRQSDKAAILATFAARVENDPGVELERAIMEVKTIARLRINALVSDRSTGSATEALGQVAS